MLIRNTFSMSAAKLTVGCLLFCMFLTGCNENHATVSGRITLDGVPLRKGDVAFYSPGSAVATSAIDADGNYELQTGTAPGLQPGSYQVTVVANDIIEPTQPFGSLMPKLITPPRYSIGSTSGLTAEVKPGHNTHNFNLTTAPQDKSPQD
jgi:hypothetical protein